MASTSTPPPPHRTLSRRPNLHPRAFAFGGWVMLLFLVLIGVCIVNSYFRWAALPPASSMRGSAAYNSGVRIGIWAVPVVVPLIMLGVAWLVGKLVSLMFGKSDGAGNIGASLVLLPVIALFGYGIYASATAPAPTPAPASAGNTATPAAPPTDTSESTRRFAEQQKAQLQAMQEQSQKTINAMRESSRKQLEALRNGTPGTAHPTPPTQSQPPGAATPDQPATPTPARAPNPAIAPTTETFTADLTKDIDAVIARSDALLPDLARTPPHDLTRIKKRAEDIKSLHDLAAALATRLGSADTALAAALKQAGIPDVDATSAARAWSMDFRATPRRFAADSLVRLCDKSAEECDYLKDNFGKWTLDSKGEIKCSDFQIKSKIGSLRFFVKADADRKQQLLDQLRGK